MKRIISILLVGIIMLCPSASFVFADNGKYTATDTGYLASTQYATREQAVSRFIDAVGIDRFRTDDKILDRFSDKEKVSFAYREDMSAAVYSGLISGYEDRTLRPQEPIARIEALVILARALSRTELSSWYEVEFSDTPDWAEKQIKRLSSAGIVKGYGDGSLGARDLLTIQQVNTLCDRITRLTGPTGDFYNYINSNWLSSVEADEGSPIKSDSVRLTSNINSNLADIIFSLYRRHYNDGEIFADNSVEKRIITIYSAAANQGYRNKIGLEPINDVLSSIDSVKTIDELISVMAKLNQYGFSTPISATVDVNIYDTSEYLPSISVNNISEGILENYGGSFKKYLYNLFTLAGEERPARLAEEAVNMCEALDGIEKSDKSDISSLVTVYTMGELKYALKRFDIKEYLSSMGFKQLKNVLVYDKYALISANMLFTDENLPLFKSYLKASVLTESAPYLTTDMFNTMQDFQNKIFDEALDKIPTDYAADITQELAGWELSSLYLDKFFADNVKPSVLSLTNKILSEYAKILEKTPHLSAETKSKAIKKLDNITVNVGAPDDLNEYFCTIPLRPIENGGSLMEYKMEQSKFALSHYAKLIMTDRAPARDTWIIYPHTVNAVYNPVSNSITIPAGILQPPFFEISADFEQNLGAIGSVIAHELSHAFDTVGSQFDEKGNLKNWWTDKDKSSFSVVCERVTDEYSSVSTPEGNVSGELTLNENIADLAGMECIIGLANEEKLDILFKSYAKIWRTKTTDYYAKTMLDTDTHSPAKVRVNRVLSNFDEFINYFGVIEGDGMYLPAENRIKIWN